MTATLLFAALAVGAPGPKDKPAPATGLIGLWEHQRSFSNGRDQTQKRSAPLRYEFRKDGTYVVHEGDAVMVGPRGFQFDPNADPPTLDTRTSRSPSADPSTAFAIYKIEGDRLTICKTRPGQARPANFDAPDGSPNHVMVFRRVKN
jgi:uncharacterized protein (TIGR03067 family)